MSLPDARDSPADTEVTSLARSLERAASSERELRALLEDAHDQIAARDREIDRLREERDGLFREAVSAHAHMRTIKRTRVWRAGTTFWALRDMVLRRR